MNNLTQTAAAKAANTLLTLVSHASDRDVERFLGLLERVAPQPNGKEIVRTVRQQWSEDQSFGRLIKRLLREVNPRCRERFVADFVLNNAWGPLAARREAFAAETGFRPPLTMLISPTMRCNLRCEGCYAGEYSQRDDLPYDVLDRVLSEAEALGIFFVTVLGGEPFVRDDLWDLYAKHRDVYFQVYTNGTLLDQAAVDRLAALGNVAPMISLEGMEAETDARRGKGTYQALMAAMDRLHAAGVLFGFSSMVTRDNVDTIVGDEFNDLLIAKGAFIGWHFLYMPVGRDPDLDLMPTAAQRDQLRQRGAARLRATKPIFVIDFWNDAPYVGGCIAAGREYLHINSQGGVEPCIFTHFAVDNVKDKSLADCLRSPFFLAIRRRQPYSDNLLRPCMLIDHPEVFREIYAQYQPLPTHPGALSLVDGLGSGLDEYAQTVAPILDRAWQEDFVARGFQPPAGPGQPGPVETGG
jgi:MoaA/NifB/PqqE/SkfB family radical SAM enzyme